VIAPSTLQPLTGPKNRGGGASQVKTRITFIERLGPDCAIGADDYQWLVLKREGEQWRAVGFIHSDKPALIRCIEAKGLKLSAAGKAALARQPDKIWRWMKAPVLSAAA